VYRLLVEIRGAQPLFLQIVPPLSQKKGAVQAPNFNKIQQSSTCGLQTFQQESLKNHKIPQTSTSLVIWFGTRRPVVPLGRLRTSKSTRPDHLFSMAYGDDCGSKKRAPVPVQVIDCRDRRKTRSSNGREFASAVTKTSIACFQCKPSDSNLTESSGTWTRMADVRAVA